MKNLFRVISPVHVRAEPTRDSKAIDALSPGDEVEVTWQGVDGWWRVTVHKVALYSEARVGKRGYCYSVGTLEPIKPPRINPDQIDGPHFPRWLGALFAAAVAATVGLVFLAIYG